LAAKAFGSVLFTNGALLAMTEPGQAASFFGSSEWDHPFNRLAFRRHALVQVAIGLYAYSMLFRDLGIETATAIAMSPFAIEFFVQLLRDGSTNAGYIKWTIDFAGSLIHIATVVSNAHGLDWAEPARKLATAFWLVHSIISILSTDLAEIWWQVKKTNRESRTYTAIVALNALAYSVLAVGLTWGGLDITQAIGYSALAYTLGLIKVAHISKEVDLVDPFFKKTIDFFWLPFMVLCAYSILSH
jgi:hypothetical protein